MTGPATRWEETTGMPFLAGVVTSEPPGASVARRFRQVLGGARVLAAPWAGTFS
jgi:hypothetical protein